tara:strand:+ start:109 stop:1566 length:1458 start_codon:yes stop_codon:yes gene_type:complete
MNRELRVLLYNLQYLDIIGSTYLTISQICINSSNVVLSSLFIALRGINNDGHDFINDAISSGANSVICESLPQDIDDRITYILVEDSSSALSVISSNFFQNPSSKIKLIGITGTNGKTSTTYYLASLFRKLNYKVGLISTIENQIDSLTYSSTHTTPNAIVLNELLSQMVKVGCDYCFMEVSSHSISQKRIMGLDFDVAVFTNISRDHLDYHITFDNYLNTKKKFFNNLSSQATSIINIDDAYGSLMLNNSKSKKVFYSIQQKSHYNATLLKSEINGLVINIDGSEICTPLAGDFNTYNLLATYAVAIELGQKKLQVLNLLSSILPVPGRFNTIKSQNGIFGIIDYAHTPDALNQVISSISNFCNLIKDLIIVVGCGGNRDQGKRADMAKIASENSKITIFTSDNPRLENPESIINDMLEGVEKDFQNKVKKIVDREAAIHFAVKSAGTGSIILVVGKGHENYQDINGQKIPFDDYKILKKFLKK